MPKGRARWMLLIAFALTAAVYWPGLSGGFLFDDYPNIVDNRGVQPQDATLPSMVTAALSSPSSEFKRPLASLSFALNYLASGLDPFWMKLTNLIIHLLNGSLIFFLARVLLRLAGNGKLSAQHLPKNSNLVAQAPASLANQAEALNTYEIGNPATPEAPADIVAVLIAAAWMLLPINLTGVLYVVQRMESMANLLVLAGLLGYVMGRCKMLAGHVDEELAPGKTERGRSSAGRVSGFILSTASILVATPIGVLAKETAVMLPLYALLTEWTMFRFKGTHGRIDRRLLVFFLIVLVLPLVAGLAWLLPQVSNPAYWSTRDFDLRTRLLSETRIVLDYVRWTLLPTPDALSFYHDNFKLSRGLLVPGSTLASICALITLVGLGVWSRKRRPLVALGIAFFLGCHLLTGTILPLELIYEHRNYFASFGVLLAVIPLLAVPRTQPFALPRHVLLAGLMLCWLALTAITAYAWGNPLRLAEDLAGRAPSSPRAQYELGRTYIIYSHYDPNSPFTRLAYAPLERSASLPESSILPEQALIFMNARMHLPIKDAWWSSMIGKLEAHRPGVQDESSLGALTQCARQGLCDLPKERMMAAYLAALSHAPPSARLLSMYGDYAWNVLGDHELGLRMAADATKAAPDEPAYLITLIRMLVAEGRQAEGERALTKLEALNIGGRLDTSVAELRAQMHKP